MLCDEILAAGDAGFIEKSREALLKVIDKVAITIIVSHQSDDIISICNRFILMDKGQIVLEGSAAEVQERYAQILKRPHHA